MAHKRNSVEVPELEKLLAGKKKKYVRYEEGAVLYSMGKNSFRQVAQDAHAVVRLQMCSTNLNQYAKRANECGQVYAADVEDLRTRLDELIDIGKQILSRLADL